MLKPANYSVIETLRDGRKVEIRAQQPDDRTGLEAAIARMSDETLHRLFFVVKRHFTEKEAAYFLNVDFVRSSAPDTISPSRRERPKSLSPSSTNSKGKASAQR
jgi:hypothetical protein